MTLRIIATALLLAAPLVAVAMFAASLGRRTGRSV